MPGCQPDTKVGALHQRMPHYASLTLADIGLRFQHLVFKKIHGQLLSKDTYGLNPEEGSVEKGKRRFVNMESGLHGFEMMLREKKGQLDTVETRAKI
jgi:hypothetical protein